MISIKVNKCVSLESKCSIYFYEIVFQRQIISSRSDLLFSSTLPECENRNWKASNLSSTRWYKFINVSSTFNKFVPLEANRRGGARFKIVATRHAVNVGNALKTNIGKIEGKEKKKSSEDPGKFLSVIMDTSKESGVFNKDRAASRVTVANDCKPFSFIPGDTSKLGVVLELPSLEQRVDRWQKDCAHLFQLPFRAHPYSYSSASSFFFVV